MLQIDEFAFITVAQSLSIIYDTIHSWWFAVYRFVEPNIGPVSDALESQTLTHCHFLKREGFINYCSPELNEGKGFA